MSESSGFSLGAWMLPKPTADGAEQQNAEHKKTDDQTPTPTEVAESSQGSPTELVDSTAFDYYFEQNGARTGDNDDGSDSNFDDLDTEEAAAIAEAMAEAAVLNTTLHCHLGAKRQREDDAQPEVPQQV